MSGGHALVSGRKMMQTRKAINMIDGFNLGTSFLTGEYLYATVDDLVTAMLTGVASQFDMLTSILILDYGFEDESNVGACIEEFIEVQDVLNQYNLRKVKLYLLTKNADLYDRIKQDYNGRDVLIYQNTEVFLTKDIQFVTLFNTMNGDNDGIGVRPSRDETLTRIQRIEQERKRLEEDAKQVEKDTLDYEKDIPQSKLNQEEYVGTNKSVEKRTKLEKERLALTRKAERLGLSYSVDEWGDVTLFEPSGKVVLDIDQYEASMRNKRKGSTNSKTGSEDTGNVQPERGNQEKDTYYPLEDESEGNDDVWTDKGVGGSYNTPHQFEEPSRGNSVKTGSNATGGHIGQSYPIGSSSAVNGNQDNKKYKPFKENVRVTGHETGGDERVEGLSTVKLLYNDLLSDGMGIVEDKLHDDSVVMTISSLKGSGGSGIVAQTAEVYAMLGRRVCVIDLDLNGRGQSYYFNTYDKRVSENKGIANALINVVEGGVINKASVSINSRIDVCGISTSVGTISERYKETIARNLNSVLIDAKEFYDIVLVDIPIEDFSLYMNKSFSNVERFLFVTENKEYEIEKLFRQYLSEFVESNGMLISDIFNNATIVLNKYDNARRDQQGYHINKEWLKEKLYAKGSPYDSILVSGEIPYARGYEEQYITSQRYVWQDSGYMATIKNMLKEAV